MTRPRNRSFVRDAGKNTLGHLWIGGGFFLGCLIVGVFKLLAKWIEIAGGVFFLHFFCHCCSFLTPLCALVAVLAHSTRNPKYNAAIRHYHLPRKAFQTLGQHH
jgi:hypothetical protein